MFNKSYSLSLSLSLSLSVAFINSQILKTRIITIHVVLLIIIDFYHTHITLAVLIGQMI